MRLFVAIELPEDVRQALATVGREHEGVRWSSPATMHLTLKFLGEVPEERVAPVSDAIEMVAAVSDPFAVRVAGGGVFPSLHNPRVLWAGITGGDRLGMLARRIDDSVVALGFDPEDRDFVGHVTLGRIRSRARPAVDAVLALGDLGGFEVREVVLFASELRPDGAVHRPLRRARLGG